MAIARDSNTQLSQSGATGITSYSVNHTCAGSNLLLIAYVFDREGDFISSVTYNSVAMTQVGKIARNNDPSQGYLYMYYLLNPSTGTNSLTATRTASKNNYIILGGTSYTGVKQSAQPDASTTNQDMSNTSLTTTVTVVAPFSMAYLCAMWDGGSGSASAGTGATLLGSSLSNWASFESSSLSLSPGSNSMTYTTGTGNGVMTAVMASFAPFTATASDGNFLAFM